MDYEKLLKNKLERIFPDEEEKTRASEIIGSYGAEKYEQEANRVRLAILKISGPDIEEIKKMAKCAKEDFRDILAWAEYPRKSKEMSMPNGPDKQKMISADRQEYEEWLNT